MTQNNKKECKACESNDITFYHTCEKGKWDTHKADWEEDMKFAILNCYDEEDAEKIITHFSQTLEREREKWLKSLAYFQGDESAEEFEKWLNN